MMQEPQTAESTPVDTLPVAPPDGWVVWTFDDGTFLYFDTPRAMIALPVIVLVFVILMLCSKRREEKKPKPRPKK